MTQAPATPLAPPGDRALALHGLTCRFGGLTALEGVTLTVEPGEILGLIGPNGAGKTTLFNVISGLTAPTAGEVRWRGQPIHGLAPDRINRLGIARTFQNLRLFDSLSVLDNVLVGLHRRDRAPLLQALLAGSPYQRRQQLLRQRAQELLDLLDLGPLAGRQAGTLAYGDRRRLEIARALATEPTLLLLDEPAAGLNPIEKDDLCQRIRQLQQNLNLTVLIIEHHVPLMMQLCDRLAVLHFGRRIALGRPETVRQDPTVIEAYLG